MDNNSTDKLKTQEQVVEFCKANHLQSYIVGRWVWLDAFDAPPPPQLRALLKAAGFRWIRKRGRWAHNCGHPTKSNPKITPWRKYGAVLIETEDTALASHQ